MFVYYSCCLSMKTALMCVRPMEGSKRDKCPNYKAFGLPLKPTAPIIINSIIDNIKFYVTSNWLNSDIFFFHFA